VIHVRRSWDRRAGEIAPKSRAGDRQPARRGGVEDGRLAPIGLHEARHTYASLMIDLDAYLERNSGER